MKIKAVCATLTACAITSAVIAKNIKKEYHIKAENIHPELRKVGTIIRTAAPHFSEKFFYMSNFFLDIFGSKVNLTKGIVREERFITDKSGKIIRVAVYSSEHKKENATGLLWIHGGGYAIGIPEQDTSYIKDFINSTGCVVVAPDYTKSTVAPYPAALNDCYTSLLWMKDNCHALNINPKKLFVGGTSAGGGLCAAVTLLARDTGDVNIAFQMPIYPMLDDRMITGSSQNNDSPIWNSKSNETAWKLYLDGISETPKYAAPARETDFSDIPPTVTYVGTIDPFYDETINYAKALKQNGVDVKLKVFDGCFHGFDLISFSTPAKQARKFLIEEFIYASENYSTE